MEHLAVWTYSPGFIPSCSDSTTSKHAEPREQFTVMVDPENQLASLISAMFILRLVSNFEVMACMMFVWDFILTFGMEVDLIWKSKWSFMKGLYLFQRYLPFTDIIWFVITAQLGNSLTETGCQNILYLIGVFLIIGFGASEMILTLRTWTVWNRNRCLSIILPILYSIFLALSFTIMVRVNKSTTFGAPPYPGYKGCFTTHHSQGMVFFWALLMLWNAVLLILMSVPAIQACRNGARSTPLTTVVYHDGIIYYLYLFVLSSINLIVIKTLPQDYQQLLLLVERMVHSMLTSLAQAASFFIFAPPRQETVLFGWTN